jgi:hypothetical protein
MEIIGKCSICGGSVQATSSYLSTVPPVPTCTSCGAKKKNDKPIIEMEKTDEGYNPRLLID